MSVGFMPVPPEDELPDRAGRADGSCTDGLLMLLTVSPMTAPIRDQRLMECSSAMMMSVRWSCAFLFLFPGSVSGKQPGRLPPGFILLEQGGRQKGREEF